MVPQDMHYAKMEMHKRASVFWLVLLTAMSFQWATNAAPEDASSDQGSRSNATTADEEKAVPKEFQQLYPGQMIEREIEGGRAHSYRLVLTAEQFLQIVVHQREIDLVAVLFDPNGDKLIETDSASNSGLKGLETIVAISESGGSYELEVHPVRRKAAAGKYEVRLEALRPATPLDRTRVAAQNAVANADRLRREGGVERLKEAVAVYQSALTLMRSVDDRKGEAYALTGLGKVYEMLRDSNKALEYYNQVLPLLRSLGDQGREAWVLHGIGDVYNIIGQRKQALEYYSKALPLRRASGDRAGEATTLNNIGFGHQFIGERQKAIEFYNQALPLFRELEDRPAEATALNNIGSVHSALGENKRALDYFGQALQLQRALGDRQGEATTLNNIGMVHQALGDQERALEHFNQALPLRRAAGDRPGEAATVNNIGSIFDARGEKQKALEYYEQTLQIGRSLGNRHVEAAVLSNIGSVYSALSEWQKALDYYNQALPVLQSTANRPAEATVLNNLGYVYQGLRENEKALEYYGRALHLKREVGDRRGEANTLTNMGLVHYSSGEKERAFEYYENALSLSRKVGDRRVEATTLANIGMLHDSSGEKQKALAYYNDAMPILREVGDRQREANTLINIGAVYTRSGETQQAMDYYTQSLRLSTTMRDRYAEARTRYYMAVTERDRSDLDAARSNIDTAVKIVESLRTRILSPDLRASYFTTFQNYYRFYIDLLMSLDRSRPGEGHAAMALHLSERARARSLLELLTEARIDFRQGVDPRLLEHERSLIWLLDAKAREQVRLLSAGHTPERAVRVEKELEQLVTQYQEVQSRIRATSPRYAALTQPRPLTLSEIQHDVVDADTLLLEYALGERRSYVWAVTPTSMTAFELPGEAVIEKEAQRVYDYLAQFQNRIGPTGRVKESFSESEAEYSKTASALAKMLLGPVASHLGKKRLCIVPDGALRQLPFAALPIPRVEAARGVTTAVPLISEHEIVILPSASTLAVMRREPPDRGMAAVSVAVMADPVFDKDDVRVRAATKRDRELPVRRQRDDGYSDAGSEAALSRSMKEVGFDDARPLPRLPFSRREAQAIFDASGGVRVLKALDFSASRGTATSEEIRYYRILHFATHGLLNNERPELSGLVLSLVDRSGKPQNGFLRVYDIYNLSLSADLVVLSACQTALGKRIQGEGLIGVTRGFMYAGAKRVIASLWKVDDEATTELMKRFYAGMMKQGLSPSAALREAQISIQRHEKWRQPYFWAGFIIQGDWQ